MTLPQSMTCIEIPKPGPECEALIAGTRPVPQPGENEILIQVAAAGVNRPDLLQRRGHYPPPPGISDVPGLEIAGTIAALGANTQRWTVGDQVCALVAGGGYAQYCVAPAAQALPIPKGLSLIEAAALPETFFTVWTNVYERCALKPGETLLVHGGSSGIGTTAIMMAKALGNPVIATAGTQDKCDACVALGAALVINYKEKDFVAEVKAFTGGTGVNVILDMVAGDYIERDLDCLADDGRIGIIAVLGGAKGSVNFAKVLQGRKTITGSTLRARPVAVKAAIASALEANIWPLIEAGTIKPQISRVVPLTRAADAHRLLEDGEIIGKVVLSVA
jgi:putative PIG3 family NAD(P)H quinone oxidoreductase